MGLVVADMSISLDGYVTGPNDSRENPFGDGAGMLHDWFGDAATDEDRAILQQLMDRVGAVVMGRTSFEKNEGDGGWGNAGPAGDVPCFVLTHHTPSRSYPAVFTFVTDGVAGAIEQAQRAAGDKVVYLFGATVMQQALSRIEARYGIESIGHSGPSDWCFGAVFGVYLCVAAMVGLRLRRAVRRS